ncbi:hypothetical protein B484DRAFT_441816 [Ochromonadaceae sp. CCMP2298]|nr:hypothetical protein B484DRAFT_441816 [Ochromonadaceae sp. CCMP2298]|mmetsp:Transcript_26368/g.58369  ORF Transcript_26368/g.58369 Transcript_26368/m.58369 type:complete len:146 (-) Transcript_26368:191-628(-)|eukprot:CAMPEP_0173318376 /NCGR_PEP_ID=MMETSP1143-20121109/27624_1 /TAXON_ID=483371 /ORGANISM="non described non described, Strain CCMP2298" /LENGTH=145 /DNA_ID=CAMNT_0014261617 /DNA_START=142 /DNA_END=579 /DNA_ORIENTATION=-
MPVHSLIFINTTGNVLYAKYFQDTSVRVLFENLLFKATSPNWYRVTATPRCVGIGQVRVVYQLMGNIIAFAGGTDDVDESTLAEVLVAVERVLVEVIGDRVTESGLLIPDNYGKFVVSVDDMMPQGVVDTLDAVLIAKLSKLKPL